MIRTNVAVAFVARMCWSVKKTCVREVNTISNLKTLHRIVYLLTSSRLWRLQTHQHSAHKMYKLNVELKFKLTHSIAQTFFGLIGSSFSTACVVPRQHTILFAF